MPDKTLIHPHLIAELAIANRELGEMLVECMRIQPEVDPEAGYGVLQAAHDLRWLELPNEEVDLLLAEADNAYKFYLTVRACGFSYYGRLQLIDLLRDGRSLDYIGMLGHVLSFCNRFNGELVTLHL